MERRRARRLYRFAKLVPTDVQYRVGAFSVFPFFFFFPFSAEHEADVNVSISTSPVAADISLLRAGRGGECSGVNAKTRVLFERRRRAEEHALLDDERACSGFSWCSPIEESPRSHPRRFRIGCWR